MIEATNMSEFKAGVEKLNEDQLEFIRDELGITPEEISTFSDDEFDEKVYDPMCDIEIEETPLDDSDLSDRGKLAESIVTVLGNSLAETNGWIDDSDD